MELWARWLVLICATAVAVYGAFRWERAVFLRLVRASRRSARRALGVIVGYHVVWLATAGFAVILVAVLHGAFSSPVPAVLLTGIAIALLGPFMFPLMPQTPYAGDQGTSTSELRRAGGTPAVARILGIGGALLWFLTMAPVAVGAVIALLAEL